MQLKVQANIVQVGMGVGPKLVRLPKSRDHGWVIETPDPHVSGVWAYENSEEVVVGLSENEIARTLYKESDQSNHIFDRGLIAVKMMLAQTPLASTILRGMYGFSGQVRIRLDKYTSLAAALEKQEPLLIPVPGSVEQFTEYLINKYRERVRDVETAIVLFSGGWDSRLELALVREVLPKGVRLVLAHVRTSSHELQTVKKIANKMDADLVVADSDKLLQFGLAWPTIMSAARSESTWRPTIPVYGTLMAILRSEYRNSFAFGFCPFPLKGRDYDREIGPLAPTTSRVRIIQPSNEALTGMRCSSTNYLDLQQTIWRSLLSGTEDWSIDQRQDWLNWNAYYAQGYAHRVRSLYATEIDPIFAHSDVVARFMGLPKWSKLGTSFIDYVLKRLMPEVEAIPVLASTGDVSRGTNKLGGSFKDSQTSRDLREIFDFRSNEPKSLYAPEVSADPMQFRIAVWKTLMRSEVQKSACAEEVLDIGGALGGHSDLNATQLADFITRTIDSASE